MYIYKKNDDYGFKDPQVNEILETDIEITEELYNRFFTEQSEGKEFRIKNINGSTFEEIFEEVIHEPIDPGEIEPSPFEKLKLENAELKKQMEETQKSMAEMMNLIAMQQVTPKE